MIFYNSSSLSSSVISWEESEMHIPGPCASRCAGHSGALHGELEPALKVILTSLKFEN